MLDEDQPRDCRGGQHWASAQDALRRVLCPHLVPQQRACPAPEAESHQD